MYDKYLIKLKKCSKITRAAKRSFERNLANNIKDNNKSFFHMFEVSSALR